MEDNKIKEENEILDKEIEMQKKLKKIIEDELKDLETVYEWEAPERVFNPRSKRWFLGIGLLSLFLIVFSALTNNFILIFAIISLVLVLYTLYSIPPQKTKHRITNKGLFTFNTLYLWKNFLTFWVTFREGEYLLHFEYKGRATDDFYRRMVILLGKGDLKLITAYLVQYIDYLGEDEIEKGFLNNLAQGKYVSLLDIVGDEDIATKDPNDSPTMMKIIKNKK